jgi:putative transposase
MLWLSLREGHVAAEEISQQVLTFTYRLLPNKRQHKRFAEILEDQRQLYNGAMEHRIDAYRKTGISISLFDQFRELTELRRDERFNTVPPNVQRWTLKRLDDAFGGFFVRLKHGGNPGFPRFRSEGRWQSFGFHEFCGITIRRNRLRVKGVGSVRMNVHRAPPESKPLSCTFSRDPKGWVVSIQYRVPTSSLPRSGRHVGIDIGISSLAVLSSGEHIPNPRTARRHERELRRRQRLLFRCKKGSKGRRRAREKVARLHLKIRNIRRTYLHQTSAKLIRENDLIAIEKLNVQGMASGILAKEIRDAGWGIFRQMLVYKAAKAGRQVIEVDARNTTQACSGCGVIVPKELKDRWHDCPECGLSLDRDHNAAINILARSGAKGAQDKAEVAYVCA